MACIVTEKEQSPLPLENFAMSGQLYLCLLQITDTGVYFKAHRKKLTVKLTESFMIANLTIMYYKEYIKEWTCDFLGSQDQSVSQSRDVIENKQHFLSNHN